MSVPFAETEPEHPALVLFFFLLGVFLGVLGCVGALRLGRLGRLLGRLGGLLLAVFLRFGLPAQCSLFGRRQTVQHTR